MGQFTECYTIDKTGRLSSNILTRLRVPSLLPEELSHIAQVSGVQWVVAHETLAATVETAFEQLPTGTLRQMWVLGDVFDGHHPLSDLMRTDLPQTDQLQEVSHQSGRL